MVRMSGELLDDAKLGREALNPKVLARLIDKDTKKGNNLPKV